MSVRLAALFEPSANAYLTIICDLWVVWILEATKQAKRHPSSLVDFLVHKLTALIGDIKAMRILFTQQSRLAGLMVLLLFGGGCAMALEPSIAKKADAAVSQPKAQASAQGASFVGDAHEVSGAAKIVEADGQRYLEFDANFHSDSGPDLFVLLHREAVPTSYSAANYVNLGRIQALDGAQRYVIPAEVDVASIKSAVIWCQQFNVTFSYATL